MVGAGVSVRPYGARDHDACAVIYETVQREIFPDDDPALYRRDDFARATKGEELWVAEVPGAETGPPIAGFASFWRPEPFLHFLLIAPQWRGRGLGKSLQRAVLDAASGSVDLKCDPRNLPAQRYYEARGWRLIERNEGTAKPYLRYRFETSV
jgi:RimJ/RimL family protein N-acetyltransferase